MQHNIETLLQNLREKDIILAESVEAVIAEKDAVIVEKDAVIVEKDAQLSVALANNTIGHSSEDGEPNHFGSVSTSGDYLKSQRSSRARWNNSVRTAEEMRVIRRIDRRSVVEWDHSVVHEAKDETVSDEDYGHRSRTPWYDPPIQRQRWDEEVTLPHVNWGDIFFDLFYVGAAYNL